MSECEKKYLSILIHFNVENDYQNLLECKIFFNGKEYVTMDNIHDAIIKIHENTERQGVFMSAPIKHYIIKAKQLALNEYRDKNLHYKKVVENGEKFFLDLNQFDNIFEYGFTEKEIELIEERLSHISMKKSKIPRRQYQKLLESIKNKLIGQDKS